MAETKNTVLIIVDGWGVGSQKDPGNPITPKTAPFYFSAIKKYPNCTLEASGESVGLFPGQEGNSEAGHLNLGAGRVVLQDALYISQSIKDGVFFKNNAFHQAMHHVKKYNTAVHLMGLLSNHNSAHSNPEHLYALLDLVHREKIKKVYLHLFTDGRDSGQYEAQKHLRLLEKYFHGNEKVATLMGRFYAMDRNKSWERVKQAYDALVLGKGKKASSPEEALRNSYNMGDTDEFLAPTVIMEKNRPVATIKNNDAVFFFNLRSDRARELTKAFVQPNFKEMNLDSFTRSKCPKNIRFVALSDFGPDLPGVLTAFPSRDVTNGLVQSLCPRKQMYIAESEKFAHITYFLNGGYAQHFCDENWVKIASPDAKNFAEKPEMSAKQLTNYTVAAINSKEYDFIAVNFANMDMVGHTGNFMAAQKAVSVIDKSIEQIMNAVIKNHGQGIITADHGNIEVMINPESGEPDTEHSINPVPFILINSRVKTPRKLANGKLANVAPTILKMMDIEKPKEMTAQSLV
ncbi:MAG: 2,3-bisphosphoglycerate-independent phosphoglycerate mutase [Candidatus Magasanikbacteria bacterium]|nr:2,3-bisphosphoglycerate-independent phosphoglycerate mutase [Candidatus Magasanikbacteria bacterium]